MASASDSCPVVSICLPCRNTYPYLQECLNSIQLQDGVTWELIVCDGFSTDGSWELLQSFCSSLPRAICFQSGSSLYEAWNECIQRAQGRYIYIATSDDALGPGALASMSQALDVNSDCGLCQIGLVYIDAHSHPLDQPDQWEKGRLIHYFPDFCSRPTRRLAPHDGVLMAAFHTIYESINQLLIRKEVFDQIGLFDPRFGAVGDFEWGMRAGLTQNCIFLPESTAYWRHHPGQATQKAFTPQERLKALEMMRMAYARASRLSPEALPTNLLAAMEDIVYDDYIYSRAPFSRGQLRAFRFYAAEMFRRPSLALRHLWRLAHASVTTTFDYAAKQRRIGAVMRRFGVPLPIFEP